MKIIFISVILLTSLCIHGQEVHLTQYYTSNLSLNPAYTGNFEGDSRITLNSRSQWAQISPSIKTNMFSAEKKIHRFPDELGVGFIFINDQVSATFLKTNKAMVSFSYQKNINQHFIRLGVQGGMVFRQIDLSSQTFPDQWDNSTGNFNSSTSNGESKIQSSWTYPDINAGASWMHRFGKTKVAAGYALFNLNKPNDSYSSTPYKLPFRHVFNASAAYDLSSSIWITPHLLYMRSQNATDFLAGVNANKRINQNLVIMGGLGYRGSTTNSDSFIGVVGGSYNRFTAGFSWDFNVSKLNQSSKSKSAWEISLIYTTPSRIARKATIPCDRY
jgi:type IX secretion system PorP/SprF family membrane protein